VLILAASDEKFNREKAKCVVLCANCHRCWHAGQGRA
jgi:predicted HNH restriction endonuclease